MTPYRRATDPKPTVRVIIGSGIGVNGPNGEHLSSPHGEVHELPEDLATLLIGDGRAYRAPDASAPSGEAADGA